MPKTELDRQLEQGRKAARPKVGARVYYPVPLPPVTLGETDEDGEFVALAEGPVTTDGVRWFPATVEAVERIEHDDYPDDYLAALVPDGGYPPLSVPVVFLRDEPPTTEEVPSG